MNRQIRTDRWMKTAALARLSAAALSLATLTLGLASCSNGTTSGFPATAASTNPLAVLSAAGRRQPGPRPHHHPLRQYVLRPLHRPRHSQRPGRRPAHPLLLRPGQLEPLRTGLQHHPQLDHQPLSRITTLWAPDASYFNASTTSTTPPPPLERRPPPSGLATAPTMAGPWTDSGGPSCNRSPAAPITPSIPTSSSTTAQAPPSSTSGLPFGSFYGGIYQREINPATGQLLSTNTTLYHLASQPGVSGNPIEGASLVQKNGYYYLFAPSVPAATVTI